MKGTTAYDGACSCGGLIEAYCEGVVDRTKAAKLLGELFNAMVFQHDTCIDPGDDAIAVFYQERWDETCEAFGEALAALSGT